MPKGSRFMMEVATRVAVPPPMPMMPCTRPCLSRSSTIAAAPAIWLLVAVSRSLRYFSRTTSIGNPPRSATSSVRMSPGKGGGSSMLKSSRMGSWPRSAMSRLTKTMSSPRVSRLQTMTMPFFETMACCARMFEDLPSGAPRYLPALGFFTSGRVNRVIMPATGLGPVKPYSFQRSETFCNTARSMKISLGLSFHS